MLSIRLFRIDIPVCRGPGKSSPLHTRPVWLLDLLDKTAVGEVELVRPMQDVRFERFLCIFPGLVAFQALHSFLPPVLPSIHAISRLEVVDLASGLSLGCCWMAWAAACCCLACCSWSGLNLFTWLLARPARGSAGSPSSPWLPQVCLGFQLASGSSGFSSSRSLLLCLHHPLSLHRVRRADRQRFGHDLPG